MDQLYQLLVRAECVRRPGSEDHDWQERKLQKKHYICLKYPIVVVPVRVILPKASDFPPWSSYPPPVPLWAIHKPRRQFRPYFGTFSVPIRPSSPPPSSVTFQTDCQPDLSTGNLPLACIAIIQVTMCTELQNCQVARQD